MHTLIHVQAYSCYFEIRFTYLVMYVLVLKLKVVSKFVNEDYGIIFFMLDMPTEYYTTFKVHFSYGKHIFYFTK